MKMSWRLTTFLSPRKKRQEAKEGTSKSLILPCIKATNDRHRLVHCKLS